MSTEIINPSNINIYGINSFINKSIDDNKLDILNLEELQNNFEIDEIDEFEKLPLPAFTQLTYNYKQTIVGEGSYDVNYNRPPIGPIPTFCYCSFCDQVGPEDHAEDCPQPNNTSIFLTLEGVKVYIVQKTTAGPYSELKNSILKKTITQEQLNKVLLLPNSILITALRQGERTIAERSNKIKTKIKFLDVVKTRGPTKVEYTTATQNFGNAIMLSYVYSADEEIKKTSIRIYNNGLINLISIPTDPAQQQLLKDTLILRINAVPNSVNLEYFSTLVGKKMTKYELIPKLSYIHSLNSQFNMWKDKDKYSINFLLLNDILSPLNHEGRIVSGEFTTVIDKPKKQIIKLNYNKYNVDIINWEYSIGKRDVIKCIILPREGIKISLQIHKHGIFQMSMSYCNVQDLRRNICSQIIEKSDAPLSYDYFNIIRNIFGGIFINKPNLVTLSFDYLPESTTLIKNTVSGKAPGNKPGTTTDVCRNKDPRPGYPSGRPIPYSFKGKCPEPNRQILNPKGVLGADGLYYPCCSAQNKKNLDNYKQYLKDGLPSDDQQAEELGLKNIPYDDKSGILVPGSFNTGALTKALIDGIWTPIKIIGKKGTSQKPQEFSAQLLNSDKIIVVKRQNLLRDSRYFPGLRSFTREQLLHCIHKNLKIKKVDETIYELENLAHLKSLIDIPDVNFNPILTVINLNLFERIKYYVGMIPNLTCCNYYLVISPRGEGEEEQIYLINNYGNIKNINLTLGQQITDRIIFNGFFDEETEKYYIIDILYNNKKILEPFSKKLLMLTEIMTTYFVLDPNIILVQYEENIIKGSKDFLEEDSQGLLVFTPEVDYMNFKIWHTNFAKIEPEIILQILQRNKTNYYELGYENKSILGQLVEFNNIFISKLFIDSQEVKINDYILFKFEKNIQTGNLASKFLTAQENVNKPTLSYNETLMKISLILNPIPESFFINNTMDNKYIWIVPNKDTILTYVNETLPLQPYVPS